MRQWMKATVFFTATAAMLAGFCMTASAALDTDTSVAEIAPINETETVSEAADTQDDQLDSPSAITPEPREANRNPDTGTESLTVPLAAAALVLGTAVVAVTAKSK